MRGGRAVQIVANKMRLVVEDRGVGTPIVFGHSLLLDSDHFGPQVEALGRHARVITVDARGHGRSGAVVGAFTLDDMVDDLCGVLDGMGLGRVILAGLSMGGMVAMRLAIREPERVAGLFLMNTSAQPERWRVRVRLEAMLRAAQVVWPSPLLIGEVVKEFLGGTTRREKPELVVWLREKLRAGDPAVFRYAVEAVIRRGSCLDGLAGLGGIPARVVVGLEDRATPAARGEGDRGVVAVGGVGGDSEVWASLDAGGTACRE
jgi:3-oxoadipate enol-lactonase